MDLRIVKDIEGDYTKCLGTFRNITEDMTKISRIKITKNDSEEEAAIKQGQFDEMLIRLGRVGELAFKYIIKKKQLEMFPNEDYDQFNAEILFSKKGLNKMLRKGFINQEQYDELNSFDDKNNQKFHNYIYLYSIIKNIMPHISNNINNLVDINIYRNVIDNYIKLRKRTNNDELEDSVEYSDEDLFNCSLLELCENNKSDVDTIEWIDISIFTDNFAFAPYHEKDGHAKKIVMDVEDKISKMKSLVSDSGDIFTRLRYFANDYNINQKYDKNDIKKIYLYMYSVISYIKEVHKYNKLDVSISRIGSLEQTLKYSNDLGQSKENIKYIFNNYSELDDFYFNKLFHSGYSIGAKRDELKELMELNKKYNLSFSNHEIIFLLGNNIKPRVLERFFENGIFDLDTIERMVYDQDDIRSYDEIGKEIKIYRSINNKKM